MAEQKESWHLDKKVPVAIIVTIFIQVLVFVYLFAQVENRVTQLEMKATALQALPVQFGRLEERIISLNATLQRIEQKMGQRER